MTDAHSLRTILLLSVCFALSGSTNSLTVSAASIVGLQIAGSKFLATLPLFFQLIGTMLAGVPASLLMRRSGRRYGFVLGTGIGIIGAATATLAIIYANFPLFCLGIFCLGILNGFGQLYRFAAADIASPEFRAKAVSFVLFGGILAGFLGPTIASETRDLISDTPFAGSYLLIIGFYALIVVILLWIRLPQPSIDEQSGETRPLREIAAQPKFIIAVLSAMIGYGVMALVMTATPLAMTESGGHPFADAAFVIQWHVVGMFAPSFFTGFLIQRFGSVSIIFTGIVFNLVCVGISLSGLGVLNFWTALVLLGIGWNFMFVAGTTMLTETYRPAEKALVQGVNDFLVFGFAAFSSLLAGILQTSHGWQAVNMSVVPLLVPVLISLFWFRYGSLLKNPV